MLLAAAESTRSEFCARRNEEAGPCASGGDAGVAAPRSPTVALALALALAVPASTPAIGLRGLGLGAGTSSQSAGTCGESNWCSARSGREATHSEADARHAASGAAEAHLESA